MNKNLLTVLTVGMAVSAVAQSNLKPLQKPDRNKIDNFVPAYAPAKLQQPHNQVAPQSSNFTLTVIDIGNTPNAYGTAFGPKTYLWAHPPLNAITFSHRRMGTVGANNAVPGFLQYSLSKDGGATWTNDIGPVYSPDGSPQGPNFSEARYPQGVLYNPTGNTEIDSAYFVYFAATRNNTNPGPNSADWGGIGYGDHQLSNLRPPKQREMKSNTAPNKLEFHLIPDGMYLSQQGTMWCLDQSNNQNAATGYRDTLNLFQGVWNNATKDFDYILRKFPCPLTTHASGNTLVKNFIDCRIAFAPNGNIGWISVLGHNDYATHPDSAFYPILYKTIDGGNNWTGPYNVNLAGLNAVNTALQGTAYTTGFEHDLVVDKNGNPYVTCAVGKSAAGWAISSAPGNWGHFVIYSPNGGTNWHAEMLDLSQNFRGNFGTGQNTVAEDSRPQAATDYTGDHLFFVWFDTDTFWNAGVGNLVPDLYARGFNVTTDKWTARRAHPQQPGVMTFGVTVGGTPAEFEVTFGNLSYYVFSSGGNYELPVSYQKLVSAGDVTSPCEHKYIKGIVYNDADFVVPTDTTAVTNGLKPIAGNNAAFGVNPNPFKDQVSIKYVLSAQAPVTVEVYNLLGDKVMTVVNNENQSIGEHRYTVDLSKHNAGIYLVRAKIGNDVITKKITQY